jgi:hypothetical protein
MLDRESTTFAVAPSPRVRIRLSDKVRIERQTSLVWVFHILAADLSGEAHKRWSRLPRDLRYIVG